MYKNIEGMTREDRRAAVRTIEARRAALVECYKQTREGEPADTIAELIARIGYADALAAVAELVNNVDEWDARIYEYVREWAQGIETAATSAELETFGIYQPSSIHPAHINQLGQAMRNTPAPIEEAEKEITEEAAEEVEQMTNNYRIENTTAPNGRVSVEVYFNSIPAKATREALKAAGFRWHSVKKCWYGYTDSENARAIIEGSADNWGDLAGATTAPSGYKWQSNGKSRFSGEYKNRLVDVEAAPQNRIKIYYNGLKLNGSKELTKCSFSVNGPDAVSIYADGYGAELPRDLFEVKNDTDYYTDYFDKDSATVTADHPLFKYVYYAAKKQAAHWAKRQLADVEKRAARCPKYADSYRKEAERARATVAEFEAMTDPGQPTAADLAKIDQERQARENARREEEHAAQLAEREKVLAERAEGRRYIEAIAEQYPIEEGAPVVAIPFSESPAFYAFMLDDTKVITIDEDGTKTETITKAAPRCVLSVTAAEIVIKHFDTRRHYENVSEGRGGYDKTDFVITWTDESGEPWSYEGRYDLGDNDGGIIAHIENLAKWDATHDKFGHETAEPQPVSAERFAWVELLKKYNRAA